ncbi:30S ribosomal protein S14 [Micromonospora sp. CPCC 206061]|uniref:30S ribosomal protein S14 n=1 Tax=Micromonospora sp. CPCC 206061 TaxID=3122410 RepID=UPI002FF270B5
MARRSLTARQARREEMVIRYAERRAALKRAVADPLTREAAVRALSRLPRDGSPVRLRSRDTLDGRPRGILTRFGLSRLNFRAMALTGALPGVRKSSR